MAYEGFLSLAGGNEIINSERARAGALAHGLPVTCDPCPGMHQVLDQAPYTGTPRTDDAPWWDISRPASSRFLGVMGLEVSGLSEDPVERDPVQLLGDGAALGSLRRTGREVVYRVALFALDDQALSYGYEWLTSALRSTSCENACSGIDACFLSSCPPDVSYGYAEFRHLYRVGLLDGMQETARYYVSGGGRCDIEDANCCDGENMNPVVAEVTFSLVAGVPSIYREAIPSNGVTDTWTDLASGKLVTKYDPDAIDDDCPIHGSCLDDPSCAQPALPPAVPVPTNPCWPTGAYTVRQSWVTISPLIMPAWGEIVPLVELYTGTKALKRTILRFYPNPAGLDCASAGADPCTACTDVSIAYLPAGATLLLDGRVQSAIVDCSGGKGLLTSSPQLYGPGGTQFVWPVFDCPSGFCIEVITEAASTSSTTQLRVAMVPRNDAA